MTHIKFKNLTPNLPDTLQIDTNVKAPLNTRSLYMRTAMKMTVGDSVGGLTTPQRASLTQALAKLYGGENRKAFVTRMEKGKIPIGNDGTYRVWRIK